MAEHRIKIGGMQVILFKGNARVKAALAAVLVFSGVALGALNWTQRQMTRKAADFRAEAGKIEYENSVLERDIQEMGSSRGVERVAQKELNMVPRDTVLIEAQVK